MKNILKIFIVLAVSSMALASCNKGTYADINKDPSTVTQGDIRFLFTQAYLQFEPSEYLYWFYISKYTKPFIQVNGGSTNDQYYNIGQLGGIGSQNLNVKKYLHDIDALLKDMSPEEAAKYDQIRAMVNVMTVYLGIFDSDLYGSMPYSESAQARYGGKLTPKYDTQKELFDTWISEINEDIRILSDTNGEKISLGKQDPVYGGDASKWLKFANGVKLKLAVRLLHADKTRALALAKEVGADEANIMTSSDNFIYNKGTVAGNNMDDYVYHFGNGVEGMGSANKNIIDFMKRNTDPRMLVMYTKNSFNSEVVQAFFDAEAAAASADEAPQIPKYILDNVNYTTDADGKKTFVSWAGDGEPWVRYYGLPLGINISDKAEYIGENNYFRSEKWRVTVDDATKSYSPYSSLNEMLVRGRPGYTYPTKPKGVVRQITDPRPWYGMGMNSGEINLYLAELKLAGASLPKTAAEYFKEGVAGSALAYIDYATKNKIPYIDEASCYDKNEKPISYGTSEINAMLAHPEYQLTGGSDDLEKVYIQQYLNFMYQPVEQFVSARRGGIPKIGSTMLPWNTEYDPTLIPRRLYVSEPIPSDIMGDIKRAAYSEEGFSMGGQGATLNTERVWYDKGAPQWGAGPNL